MEQPTLTQLLCEGNPQIVSAPENMTSNTKLLLVCLEMQTRFNEVLNLKETQRNHLQDQSLQLRSELSKKRQRVEQLEKSILSLEWERPDRYIYWKQQFLAFLCFVREKFRHLWKTGKGALSQKTHPLY